MTKAAEQIFRQAMSLEPAERVQIAELLLDHGSGDVSTDPQYVAAWEKEIEKRIGEIKRGEVEMIPWETVRDELEKRHADR